MAQSLAVLHDLDEHGFDLETTVFFQPILLLLSFLLVKL